MHLIQCCFDITDYQTKEKEIKSLLRASEELKSENLLVITSEYEGEEKIKSQKIKFIPLWKWLLLENEN
jgi:predicted AAA+ superfamily ATPase